MRSITSNSQTVEAKIAPTAARRKEQLYHTFFTPRCLWGTPHLARQQRIRGVPPLWRERKACRMRTYGHTDTRAYLEENGVVVLGALVNVQYPVQRELDEVEV